MSEQQKTRSDADLIRHFHELLPSPGELKTVEEIAAIAIKTGYLRGHVDSVEQATYVILKGQELGIKPIQALSQLYVIEGKVSAMAELIQALIYKNCPSAVIHIKTYSNEECTIQAQRSRDQPPTTFSYTLEDAIRAQKVIKTKDGFLDVGKSGPYIGNYAKNPRAMLRSRCITEMGRTLFPDALMGLSYTPDELGATFTDQGEVIPPAKEKPASAPANLQNQVEGRPSQADPDPSLPDLTDFDGIDPAAPIDPPAAPQIQVLEGHIPVIGPDGKEYVKVRKTRVTAKGACLIEPSGLGFWFPPKSWKEDDPGYVLVSAKIYVEKLEEARRNKRL